VLSTRTLPARFVPEPVRPRAGPLSGVTLGTAAGRAGGFLRSVLDSCAACARIG
jgi:hypothetical protein